MKLCSVPSFGHSPSYMYFATQIVCAQQVCVVRWEACMKLVPGHVSAMQKSRKILRQ